MFINSTIVLEADKGQHISQFINDIKVFKIKNNIDTSIIAKFNGLVFEIPAEVQDYDKIYEIWEHLYY
jgi:hypothetical protein